MTYERAKKSKQLLNWSILESLLKINKYKNVSVDLMMPHLNRVYRPIRNLYDVAETDQEQTASNLCLYS